MQSLETLFPFLHNETTMLFAKGISMAVLMLILLVVVVFATRAKTAADRYHDLKQIEMEKTTKLAMLDKELRELKTEHMAALEQLKLFDDTKVVLKETQGELGRYQQRVGILEKELSETQQKLDQSEAMFEKLLSAYKTLQTDYKSLDEQNAKLRANNSRLVTKLELLRQHKI